MHWRKLGRIVEPDRSQPWSQSYAMMPTPIEWDKHRLRVFYGSTDAENFGRIGYVDLDRTDPTRVLDRSTVPILDVGELGTFDDSGVVPSCYVREGSTDYLFYVGFQRSGRVPYTLFTGLAISTDGGTTFRRWARTPVIERTSERPFSLAAPFVSAGMPAWRMWYWFANQWIEVAGKQYMQASIGYAESNGPTHWKMDPVPTIECSADEFTVGRPWVLQVGHEYWMWYSKRSRSTSYRLGLATSHDGKKWTRRDDDVGLDVSDEGWDSQMVCYPAVISVKDKTYLFYNGNGNGQTGFGIAELVGTLA
ncbi:hypothetical protein K2X85_03175 [bacterium]|nr:hypothetical protein [bacterium]